MAPGRVSAVRDGPPYLTRFGGRGATRPTSRPLDEFNQLLVQTERCIFTNIIFVNQHAIDRLLLWFIGLPCLDVVVSLDDGLFRELDDRLENRGFNFTGLDRLSDIRAGGFQMRRPRITIPTKKSGSRRRNPDVRSAETGG